MARERRSVVPLFLCGVAASVVGDTAMMLAAGIWMKSLTGSDSLAALTTLCLWAPMLAARSLGRLADRFRAGRLLVVVPLATAAGLSPLLALPEPALPGGIFTAMTVYGTAFVVLGAAEGALLPRLLEADQLARVNGYRTGIQEGGGKIVAPALGAGVYAVAGPGWVVAGTITALVVAALLFALVDRVAGDVRAGGDRRDRAAPAATRTVPGLRRLVVGVGLGMFATGANGAFLYRLIDHELHQPPAFIGVTSVAAGCGAAAMGLVSGRVFVATGAFRTAALGLLLSAVGYLLLASGSLQLAVAGSLLGGAGLPVALVAVLTHVQSHAPPDALGATVAGASAAVSLPLPAGTLAGALAVTRIEAPPGYLATSALAAAGALVVGFSRSAGGSRRRPPRSR